VKTTRFKCAVCGKLTAGRVPRDGRHVGDGTFRFPRRHRVGGEACPGNIVEAEWVDVDQPTPGGADPNPRPS